MGNPAEAIDWQSETIIADVISLLSDRLRPWLEERDLIARLPSGTLQIHLRSALDFAGEQADGYVMARFLEDNRKWPADQYLVAILRETATCRKAVIRRASGPLVPEPDADGFYPVGTRFKYGTWVYEITKINRINEIYDLKRLEDGETTITYRKSLASALTKGEAAILPRDDDTF